MELVSLYVLEERVNRGAQLLDLHRPGWAREIDIDQVEVACPVHSVTGQLFGPVISEQMAAVGIDPPSDEQPWSDCDAFSDAGFCVLRAEMVVVPESIRDRITALITELSATVGKDVGEVLRAPRVVPVPRSEDVVSQESYTLETIWGKAIRARL